MFITPHSETASCPSSTSTNVLDLMNFTLVLGDEDDLDDRDMFATVPTIAADNVCEYTMKHSPAKVIASYQWTSTGQSHAAGPTEYQLKIAETAASLV